MKTKVLILMLFTSIFSFGQTNTKMTCIYKTYQDYLNNKPTQIINIRKGEKLVFTFPAGLEIRLKSKTKEGKKIYKPGDIWGYMKEGELYRYYQTNNQKETGWEYKLYYKVIYNKEIIIYSVLHAESGTYAGASDNISYYYSKNLKSTIKKVNDKNLSADFKDKPDLVKKIKEKTK